MKLTHWKEKYGARRELKVELHNSASWGGNDGLRVGLGFRHQLEKRNRFGELVSEKFDVALSREETLSLIETLQGWLKEDDERKARARK